MKEKILSGLFTLALISTVAYGVSKSNKNETALSDLTLSNVEALADDEIGSGRWIVTIYSPSYWDCTPDGGVNCPGTPF